MAITTKEEFRTQLKQLMSALKVNASGASRIMNCSDFTVRQWVSGKTCPRSLHRIHWLNKLRAHLNLPSLVAEDDNWVYRKPELVPSFENGVPVKINWDTAVQIFHGGVLSEQSFYEKVFEAVASFDPRHSLRQIEIAAKLPRDHLGEWLLKKSCPPPTSRTGQLNRLLEYAGLPALESDAEEVKRIYKLKRNHNIQVRRHKNPSHHREVLRKANSNWLAKVTSSVEGLQKMLWNRARCRAHNSGNCEFSLLPEDIPINTHCPVFGTELKVQAGLNLDRQDLRNSLSIDRLDSCEGYIRGNITTMSRRANELKRDATLDEMIALGEWAKRIKEGSQ